MAPDAVEGILAQLAAAGSRAGELLDLYRTKHDALFRADPRLHRAFARALIGAGQPTRALEVIQEGLTLHDPDFELELRYLEALASSRRGDLERAGELAETLAAHPGLSPKLWVDASSLAARLEKAKIEGAADAAEARRLAAKAARAYEAVWRRSGDYFPGINAATLYRISGPGGEEAARRIAAEVEALVRPHLPEAGEGDAHWLYATLGEALLLLGRGEEALAAYRAAAAAAGPRAGDVVSMRRNAELLARELELPAGLLELLAVGRVVVFAGHMLDRPGRQPARFPPHPELEEAVRAAIRREIEDCRAIAGFSSAACGADTLFAEEMLAAGRELHVVLPFALDDFLRESVDFGLKERAGWRRRAEAILARATRVHQATAEPYLEDEELFRFVNQVTQGLAVIRAGELGVAPLALAVLEPGAPAKVGGTASFLAQWRGTGREAREIDLAALRHQALETAPAATVEEPPAPTPARPASPPAPHLRRTIRTMLFADVKNFSKLQEHQAPAFFVRFLGLVAAVLGQVEAPPDFRNTWGDGLFLVFAEAPHAAAFARRLLAEIAATDWQQEVGLPPDTAVRVGLHSGPVYPADDPILGRPNFFGSHVNRAARIEPVTAPGHAYASETFAALLALDAPEDPGCEFVGIVPLAKGYGEVPLYRLRRALAPG